MGKTLTVTSKGQVTLRREVLEHLGVAPGDKIAIDFLPSGRAEVRAAKLPASIEGFIGCLALPGEVAPSIEEMNEVIAEGWAGKR
ncbi:MAG TPA: AbrB/MazE/SpoVT family DNA-binding domain-containing protein [Aliidongia sp.]|nr:AbrB/MazE/SpoVT family DNA-binding domain-containing protein [Aliidongia sp.]